MNMQENVNKILVDNGLDFTIEKHPFSGKDNKGNEILSPYYGLYNTKTGMYINSVKEGYTISQNSEIVEMVLKGMEKFGNNLNVTNAGSIHDGRKVYLQISIEGDGILNDGDRVKRYVTIIDSNDGSTSLSVGIGDKTMSCKNQFYRFYKAGEAKFRHTSTIEQKILSIPSLIETALSESLKQVKIYNGFQSTKVSRELAHQMVNAVLGYDKISIVKEGKELSTRSANMMESLYSHIAKEMKEKGNTLWGLHSGVTSWTTHDRKGPKRYNGQIESLLVGTSYKKNMTSFKFALAEAKKMKIELV